MSFWVDDAASWRWLEEQYRAERTKNHPPRTKHTKTEIFFFLSISLVLLYYRLVTSCTLTSGCGQLPAIVCINFLCKKCHLAYPKVLPSPACRLWFLKVLEMLFTPFRISPAIYSFKTQQRLRLNVVKWRTIISCIFYAYPSSLSPRTGKLEETSSLSEIQLSGS